MEKGQKKKKKTSPQLEKKKLGISILHHKEKNSQKKTR